MLNLTVAESRRALHGSVPESEWESTIEEALKVTGHVFVHFRPAMVKGGWRTALSGDPGFPDVVAIGVDGLQKVAELKTLRGKVTPEQQVWLDRFKLAGALVVVLRPGQHVELAAFVGARIC